MLAFEDDRGNQVEGIEGDRCDLGFTQTGSQHVRDCAESWMRPEMVRKYLERSLDMPVYGPRASRDRLVDPFEALAAQRGEVIVLSGAAASNVLGLTTQVLIRSVNFTSGRSRTFSIGKKDVELATLDWVHWYNKKRLYGPLGYISPATAERNFYQAQLTAKIAAE